MRIFDISWPISPAMTTYKNRKDITFAENKVFDRDGVRDSSICINTHTGTHVDAPSHFLKDGKTIDQITLDRLVGKALVIDCTRCIDSIDENDLKKQDIQPGDIVLLRTQNSALDPQVSFEGGFVYLDQSGASFLAQKQVKAVGIDYLGIERGNPEHPTHTTLMHADSIIIEGLRLAHVPAGIYFMVCLPLALIGLEAAPARAILMAE